jgi:hypothetical protein
MEYSQLPRSVHLVDGPPPDNLERSLGQVYSEFGIFDARHLLESLKR